MSLAKLADVASGTVPRRLVAPVHVNGYCKTFSVSRLARLPGIDRREEERRAGNGKRNFSAYRFTEIVCKAEC